MRDAVGSRRRILSGSRDIHLPLEQRLYRRFEQRRPLKELLGKRLRPLVEAAKRRTKTLFLDQLNREQTDPRCHQDRESCCREKSCSEGAITDAAVRAGSVFAKHSVNQTQRVLDIAGHPLCFGRQPQGAVDQMMDGRQVVADPFANLL